MALYLGILLFSFIVTGISLIPFIDFLYRLRLTNRQSSPLPDKLGTPIGAGVLIIFLVTFLFVSIFILVDKLGVYINSSFPIRDELNVLFFTFISFGLLGLYDDLIKTFRLNFSNKFKNPLQLLLSLIVAFLLYQNLHVSILNIPFSGVFQLGWLYIPVATLVIYSFARGVDITDGLDGLAGGTLLVALMALWAISQSLLDTPLSIFLALWVGSLIAFLYFNVYPARIWMGNSGSLAFGATLAVTGLLLGKTSALLILGGIFLAEGLANLLQDLWKRIYHRPLFPVSPPHYWLASIGWPESKIVFRTWLAAIVLAVVGLWISGK